MQITRENVEYIAALAKLNFSETEKEQMAKDLARITDYIEKLNELDTEQVKPLFHPMESSNVMREDEVKPSFSKEVALKNAPDSQDAFFKVPKVIK
jgi:aspartyl-tRNA(Asn)/glutamyl-tRNA(Gln) amidotransferase subunit C